MKISDLYDINHSIKALPFEKGRYRGIYFYLRSKKRHLIIRENIISTAYKRELT